MPGIGLQAARGRVTMEYQRDLVAAAKRLRPQIVAARQEIERSRRLPAQLVSDMDAADLFRAYVSRDVGGPEVDPMTAFRVVEEVSRADGSVGWCCFVAGSLGLFTGWLDTVTAREMFGEPCTLRGSGSFRPLGTARAVEGGYQVSGRWDFASGCHHANWLFLNCQVIDGDAPRHSEQGLPVLRMMSVPIDRATVIENWSVIGLLGTGSNDVAVADLFVPERHTFSLLDQPQANAPICTFQSAMATTFTPLAGNTLGMARGAMDAFLELANGRATTMNPDLLRDRQAVQEVVGRAEAIISGARAYVVESVGKLWPAMNAGQADMGAEVFQARLSVTHAVHESVRAIDLLFHASGTNAVRQDNLLERYFRDAHAAMFHAGGLLTNFEQAGRVALGLPPGAPGW